eukprot:Pgem_evm2s12948
MMAINKELLIWKTIKLSKSDGKLTQMNKQLENRDNQNKKLSLNIQKLKEKESKKPAFIRLLTPAKDIELCGQVVDFGIISADIACKITEEIEGIIKQNPDDVEKKIPTL